MTLKIENQCVASLTVHGHAGGFPGGNNPICAAVTALVRTAARTLESQKGIVISGGADQPGDMIFHVNEIPAQLKERVTGITDFLITGLRDLERENPNEIELQIVQT